MACSKVNFTVYLDGNICINIIKMGLEETEWEQVDWVYVAHDSGPPVYINGMEFIEQMRKCWVLNTLRTGDADLRF